MMMGMTTDDETPNTTKTTTTTVRWRDRCGIFKSQQVPALRGIFAFSDQTPLPARRPAYHTVVRALSHIANVVCIKLGNLPRHSQYFYNPASAVRPGAVAYPLDHPFGLKMDLCDWRRKCWHKFKSVLRQPDQSFPLSRCWVDFYSLEIWRNGKVAFFCLWFGKANDGNVIFIRYSFPQILKVFMIIRNFF